MDSNKSSNIVFFSKKSKIQPHSTTKAEKCEKKKKKKYFKTLRNTCIYKIPVNRKY